MVRKGPCVLFSIQSVSKKAFLSLVCQINLAVYRKPEGQYFLCCAKNWASAMTSLSTIWTGMRWGRYSILGGTSNSKLTKATCSSAKQISIWLLKHTGTQSTYLSLVDEVINESNKVSIIQTRWHFWGYHHLSIWVITHCADCAISCFLS